MPIAGNGHPYATRATVRVALQNHAESSGSLPAPFPPRTKPNEAGAEQQQRRPLVPTSSVRDVQRPHHLGVDGAVIVE